MRHYSLYVILDIFSRYVVGWLLADRESKTLAQRLIEETVAKQEIPPGQLFLHADRGSAMTSDTVAQLLADLGVLKSHSRPHTNDDNPFSEAQFKTLKYPRSSRITSPERTTLASSVAASSIGTTGNTATRASLFSRPSRSTPAALRALSSNGLRPSTPPIAPTLLCFGWPPQPQWPPQAAWIRILPTRVSPNLPSLRTTLCLK